MKKEEKKLANTCVSYIDAINSLVGWLIREDITEKELNYWINSINACNKRLNDDFFVIKAI